MQGSGSVAGKSLWWWYVGVCLNWWNSEWFWNLSKTFCQSNRERNPNQAQEVWSWLCEWLWLYLLLLQSLNPANAVCDTSKSGGLYSKQVQVPTDRFGSGSEASTAKRQQSTCVVSLEFYLCIWVDLSAFTHLFKSESLPPRGSTWRMPRTSWAQLAQSPAAFYTLAGWCAARSATSITAFPGWSHSFWEHQTDPPAIPTCSSYLRANHIVHLRYEGGRGQRPDCRPDCLSLLPLK